MSARKRDDETINQIDDLFGEPSLINGEDRGRYMRIRAAVEADIKPKGVSDWMMVRDLTDKYWEELRYKRSAAALIDGASREAVESYERLIARQTMFLLGTTGKYFSTDPKTRKEAALYLEQHGVTTEQIQAKAMQIVGGSLQMLDRMIVIRETGRRILRKEHEQRLAKGSACSEGAEKVDS